jgi:hypothetical protein
MKRWLIAVVTLVMIGAQGCSGSERGVRVSISNQSESPMQNVVVAYTGGRYELPRLLPNETDTRYVNPVSESDLEVEFTEASGNRRKKTIGTYFERGYSGSISITVGNAGQVTVKDEISAISY